MLLTSWNVKMSLHIKNGDYSYAKVGNESNGLGRESCVFYRPGCFPVNIVARIANLGQKPMYSSPPDLHRRAGSWSASWLWRHSLFLPGAALPLRLPARKVAALPDVLLAGFGIAARRTLYMLCVVAVALWPIRMRPPILRRHYPYNRRS